MCTVLHPDHEENEEAIREADAKQSVDEKACDVFLLMWRKDHVNFGVRPVHIEEHHVDKTLLVEPPVGLVKVLLNVHLIFLNIFFINTFRRRYETRVAPMKKNVSTE